MEQINTNDAAIMLKCCQATVIKLVRDGLLVPVSMNHKRGYLFDKADVLRLAEETTINGKTSREQNLVDDLLSLSWPATANYAAARLDITTTSALLMLGNATAKNLVTRHKHGKRLYFLMTDELLRHYVKKFCD